LRLGVDGVVRCLWCGDDPQYIAYHDDEWGHAVIDDTHLFEKFCLEGFQSGLSWLTILRKRENFRAAFAGFDIAAVAAFDQLDVSRLLSDAGIVRHRGKIESTINNAGRAIELIDETGSLFDYVARYRSPRVTPLRASDEVQPTSPESVAMSKDLKTTMYAFMQAMGLVNDHIEGCERMP
jgi:DNA-3-methyladenine glycosylase I